MMFAQVLPGGGIRERVLELRGGVFRRLLARGRLRAWCVASGAG